MRTHIASIFTLLLSAAAGCGAVDDGACPTAMQSDDVACTLDVCNAESGAWAHIPDNSICGAGMRCDPAGGCVAAGALTGQAFLFGHTDHSGITVSIDGLEGVSTTTDAMGNWALEGLPTGSHDVVYTKTKYITERSEGVAVLADAANSPEDVVLTHGADVSDFSLYDIFGNGSTISYSPNKKAVVIRSGIVSSSFNAAIRYYAYRLDQPSAPVEVAKIPCCGGLDVRATDTHAVWTNQSNDAVWSRPLDGGPPVLLGTALPNQSIGIVGTPNTYAVLRTTRFTGVYDEHKLYVVKVDGSTPMGSPVYTTPDANNGFRTVVSNDTHAIVFLFANAGSTSLLARIDLAAGTLSPINTGHTAHDSGVFSSNGSFTSPNRQYLYGNLYQSTGSGWDRAFLLPISGPAGVTLAPDDDGAPSGFKRSDYANSLQWFADSTGIVYASSPYTSSNGVTILEGQLKVWHVNQTGPANIAAQGDYYTGFVTGGTHQGWSVHGKTVVWRDLLPAPPTASQATLMVSAVHSNTPTAFPVNATGSYLADFTFNDEDPAASYMVFTESVSNANAQRSKILSVNLAMPLLSAPSVVQLGGALSVACASQYEAVLSDTTYWQLCRDTGVLTGYAKSTNTPGAQTMSVREGLYALPEADRVGYRRYDGKLYSSPNTGTLTEVKLISSTWDQSANVFSAGSWVFFRDIDHHYTRASNADGSVIDEPMSACVQTFSYDMALMTDADKTHVWLHGLECEGLTNTDFAVSVGNLP